MALVTLGSMLGNFSSFIGANDTVNIGIIGTEARAA